MGSLDYIRHNTKRRLMRGERVNWIENSRRANCIRAAVLAAPFWVRRTDFIPLERERDELTRLTGIPHTTDHIVPLNHPAVCGLTVRANLRVVPKAVNAFKGNKFDDGSPLHLNFFERMLGNE